MVMVTQLPFTIDWGCVLVIYVHIHFYRYYDIKRDLVMHGKTDAKQSGSVRREGVKVARARNWLARFIEESGDDALDNGKKYLPSVFTVLDLFRIYRNELE